MFEHLLSPLTVGRLALPNRVLITAHATNYIDADGLPDERAVHYYAERAKGGAGLMWRLREQGVELMPSTRFVGWDSGRPVIGDVFTGAARALAGVDPVVWAGPGQASAELLGPLRAAGLEVHAVGDCVAPRRVEHAVYGGHAAARAL